MKIIAACLRCIEEHGPQTIPGNLILSEIPESQVVEWTCSRGHLNHTIMHYQKYELLSEMALNAIVDEHYGDAVRSFATSLERLFEYYIRFIANKRAINNEQFLASWKNLKLSERQLGAFVSTWLFENEEAAILLNDDRTKFRNNVIHNGRLPSKAETIDFGQAVADVATPILKQLGREENKSLVWKMVFERTGPRWEKARASGAIPNSYGATSLFRPIGENETIDVQQAVLERLKRPKLDFIFNTISS